MGLKRGKKWVEEVLQSCSSLRPCRVIRMQQQHGQQHHMYESMKITKFRESVSITEKELEISDVICTMCYTVVFYFYSQDPPI